MGRQYGTRSISSEEAHAFVEAEKKEAEAKRLKTEKCIAIGAVALGVVFLGIGIFTKVTGPAKIAELDAQIAANNETLTEKQEFIESGGNIQYVDPVMSSAKEAGEQICRLQNELITFDTAHWINLRSMQSADARLDFTDEHKACLQEFQTWISTENTASIAAAKTASGIWSYYGRWEFYDVFDYEGDELNVVWLCYDTADVDKSQPLAFVTGTYSAYQNKVYNLVRYITPTYSAMVSADSLRNTSAVKQDEVYNPNSSVLQFDQAGDPSIGAPNGMSPEEVKKWNEEHMGNTNNTNNDSGTTSQDDTQPSDTGQQWTSPQASANSQGEESDGDSSEATVVLDMGN